jgi:hypothetical protein
LRYARVPLLRFLNRQSTENGAVRKLRLRRVWMLKGGKLRPHLHVRQPCLMKTSVQTGIGTPLRPYETTRDFRFGF